MSTNFLINETSPYLLQHANNPVLWHPWGEEVFAKAAELNKPIFLSIGYSTCHWCHVMERESFANNEVAAVLNEHFISIKVDREERPDIDAVYMNVCQMLTGGGGWPLTIIMTPEKQPFFAGTYFPKDSSQNRVGLMDLLPRIAKLWNEQKQDLVNSAQEISSSLHKTFTYDLGNEPDITLVQAAYNQLEQRFDEVYGGFGTAPKFPSPHNIVFLLRYQHYFKNPKALHMAEKTLHEMRLGGMYDHIGGGFHRYSTDRKWLLPHFEKMLYDQALLVWAYAEAYAVTGKAPYRDVVSEIVAYLKEIMISPQGAFFSAEDADSEHEEGKFYMWEAAEIENILGNDAGLFSMLFNIEQGGNFTDPFKSVPEIDNIPYLKKDIETIARDLQKDKYELTEFIQSCIKKLKTERNKRVRPFRDEKILTDWNSLITAALAIAGGRLNEPEYISIAENTMSYLLYNHVLPSGELVHMKKNESSGVPATMEDYGYIIWALLELYDTTYKLEYLHKALEFTEQVLDHYKDVETGGFYFTADNGEKLITRLKEIYDGAIPSSNSVMIQNLIRLAHLTGDFDFEHEAMLALRSFTPVVSKNPGAFTYFMSDVLAYSRPWFEVVIAGKKDSIATKRFIRELKGKYAPNLVTVIKDTATDDSNLLNELIPFTEGMIPLDGEPTLYLCKNFNCNLPTQKIDEVLDQID
ncbi:MAG: thioredoxin domain-containing protein [Ignavibacteria bacterium]|nr:thioredoxin domain-containing protein [Ignavibacteria bacterium]